MIIDLRHRGRRQEMAMTTAQELTPVLFSKD